MQDVSGERGGYLHGRGALDSDDLLYLKEQMEAEEDAERLLRRTEKRAFQAFKISFYNLWNQSNIMKFLGNRQQDLLKRVVEVKSKKLKESNPSNGSNFPVHPTTRAMPIGKSDGDKEEIKTLPARPSEAGDRKIDNPVKSLLSAYDSSDDDDD
ncbi:hypothetical protein BC332_32623 [Capsicum chinense]|nr:hypothetical protein BC332_32623 [Capsicum chinense]